MKADLDDLKKELWFRFRNDGTITWTTKEGKTIPIKDMDIKHLINTITMLEIQEQERDLEGEGPDWIHFY